MKIDQAITTEAEGTQFYYHRDGIGGAWLLSYNAINPEEDDQYRAFTSERKLRAWVRGEWPTVEWEPVDDGARLWRGCAVEEVEPEGEVAW